MSQLKTIENVNFGKIKVDESQKITFSEGLFGFENYSDYYLADVDIAPFLLLQEENNEQIGFVVADPFLFFADYEFDLEKPILKALDVKDESDLLILVIITLSDKMEEITANLLGPIIVNRKNHTGLQYIISNEKFKTKHKLFPNGVKGDD